MGVYVSARVNMLIGIVVDPNRQRYLLKSERGYLT